MAHRKIFVGLTLAAALGFLAAYIPGVTARADSKPAAAPTCKLHGKKCCDPAIAAHLPKEAVYKACGESDATYLGEDGSEKDTCKYVFKVEGEKEENTYVQVYAPNPTAAENVRPNMIFRCDIEPLLIENGRTVPQP